jgi:hypothetical protein
MVSQIASRVVLYRKKEPLMEENNIVSPTEAFIDGGWNSVTLSGVTLTVQVLPAVGELIGVKLLREELVICVPYHDGDVYDEISALEIGFAVLIGDCLAFSEVVGVGWLCQGVVQVAGGRGLGVTWRAVDNGLGVGFCESELGRSFLEVLFQQLLKQSKDKVEAGNDMLLCVSSGGGTEYGITVVDVCFFGIMPGVWEGGEDIVKFMHGLELAASLGLMISISMQEVETFS